LGAALLFDYPIYFSIPAWRFLREGPTNTWTILTADVSADSVFTRLYSKVELIYTYNFESKRRPGSYEVLFMSRDAARECAQFFVKGSHVRVLVKPQSPDESVIRRADLRPY
jgi:hypothetical protein